MTFAAGVIGPTADIMQLRVACAYVFKRDAVLVNAGEKVAVSGSETAVKSIRFADGRVATDLNMTIVTADGLVQIGERYPWLMEPFEIAVFLRAAMHRHHWVAT